MQKGEYRRKTTLDGTCHDFTALNYFYLLPAFADTYDPDVNPGDLGVLLVTSTSVTDTIPSQSILYTAMALHSPQEN